MLLAIYQALSNICHSQLHAGLDYISQEAANGVEHYTIIRKHTYFISNDVRKVIDKAAEQGDGPNSLL